MKKNITRIMACFMACVIAFNVIAIPRAKAVVTEVVGTSALATSAVASYMTATGVPLTVITGGASSAASGVTSIVSGYAAATGTTSAAVLSGIASGATITAVGAIALSAVAVASLAAIVAWVINEYNLEAGAVPVPVAPSVDADMLSYNGFVLPDIETAWTDKETYPYALYCSGDGVLYVFTEPVICAPSGNYWYISRGSDSTRMMRFYVKSGTDYWQAYGNENGNKAPSIILGASAVTSATAWTNFDIINSKDSSLYMSATEPKAVEDWENPILSATLDADYEPVPEVPETKQMVLDVGADAGATEETIYNLIFNNIADGTLTSTYEITDANTDGNTEPDVGTDADPKLGLLERIAVGVESLTDSIVDGIANIFAPDAALMQEISDTFTSKFGFVTTLHDLGSDLLSISADSEPPVVYIHLEDAEGNIDYGGTVKALDMTWYSRYKADADKVLSGFLWLGFVWMLFKRVPSIIKGTSMETEERSKL